MNFPNRPTLYCRINILQRAQRAGMRVLLNSQNVPEINFEAEGGGIYLVTINLPGWTSKTCTKERDYHRISLCINYKELIFLYQDIIYQVDIRLLKNFISPVKFSCNIVYYLSPIRAKSIIILFDKVFFFLSTKNFNLQKI